MQQSFWCLKFYLKILINFSQCHTMYQVRRSDNAVIPAQTKAFALLCTGTDRLCICLTWYKLKINP